MDFKKVFLDSLEDITPSVTKREMESGAYSLNKVGIFHVKRMAYALVFKVENADGLNRQAEIWIEDPQCIRDHMYPHFEVRRSLEEFLEEYELEHWYVRSAYVYQDKDDKLYIMLGQVASESTEREIKSTVYSNTDEKLEWIEFIERYNITKIFGDFRPTLTRNRDSTRHIETIIDSDVMRDIREDIYLQKFGEDQNMDTQTFLSFRTIAKEALKSNQQIDLTQLLHELVR